MSAYDKAHIDMLQRDLGREAKKIAALTAENAVLREALGAVVERHVSCFCDGCKRARAALDAARKAGG